MNGFEMWQINDLSIVLELGNFVAKVIVYLFKSLFKYDVY